MNLTKKEIQHIANLARLELTDEEIDIYGEQLSHVLNYIDQLREVETKDVEPTAQVTGLGNVFRNDEIREWNNEEVESSLTQSPEKESKQIKVKRILN